MRNFLGTAWQQRRALLTSDAFAFGRPLVVFQSDDWARVGVRDREGWEELKAAGVHLGERNYDFYSLETAEDVEAITALLLRHRDSTGRPACLGMNFLLANVDFSRVRADNFRQVYLRPLNEGLPEDWNRPGLLDAYHTVQRTSAEAPSSGTCVTPEIEARCCELSGGLAFHIFTGACRG